MLDNYVALNRRTPLPPSHVTLDLTRFQRILLGTDGTVTDILEAFAGEPVDVVKLLQSFDTAGPGDADLLVSDDPVLRRRVVLRRRHSGNSLLYAEAVVVLHRVDAAVLDGLVESDKSVGILLKENRMETFREILRIGREPAGFNGVHFGVGPTVDLISRTYRIMARGQPIILITEKFPANFFLRLPD